MRPSTDRQCHILRLPYELLKPIIADLSQRDQLSIAKTCVHLWELAYPLAYDRIVVEANPAIADIVWRNLASGVCLRYVRHLDVRFLGQSTTNTEKQYHTADVVVGIMLAALRRHQLLSFSLTHAACTTSMLSTKNTILLLETQQQLAQVNLPGIRDSVGIRIDDYLPKSAQFHQLRNITFQICTSDTSDSLNSFIVQNSPSLNSLHLRFSAAGEEAPPCIFTTPTRTPLCRKISFSMATKLTIHGCNFGNMTLSSVVPIFPALRALAVVDCKEALLFCICVPPAKFPELRALMFTITDGICGRTLGRFIEKLPCLRELIVYGEYLYWSDNSSLLAHADTLEVLSLHNRVSLPVLASEDDVSPSLTTLRALRHLSCYMGNFNYGIKSGVENYEKDVVGKICENIIAYDKLKTLGLHCSSRVSPEYHPWVHLERSYFTNEEISLISNRAHSEKLIRDATFTQLMHENSALDSTALEFVAVTVQSNVLSSKVPTGAMERITQAQQVPKSIMSFQPKRVLQSASQVRKEMIARYAADNYYFLGAYIDTMTEESSVRFDD